jgi:hypothetical protein
MSNAMKLADTEIYMVGTMYKPPQTMTRSLGGAILLAAVADYHSTDEQEHKSAEQFLYPRTRKWRDHYDWAVELAEGTNAAWLREALDRSKDRWDGQRAERIARERRRALKADRRNRPDEEQRGEGIHADRPLVATERRGNSAPSFQPAGEACGARASEVAPGL